MSEPCFQLTQSSICGASYATVWVGGSNEAAFSQSLLRNTATAAIAANFNCTSTAPLSSVLFLLSQRCSAAAAMCIQNQQQSVPFALCSAPCNAAGLSLQYALDSAGNTFAALDGVEGHEMDAVNSMEDPKRNSLRIVRVVHPYKTNFADELKLVVGASIAVVAEYPDGWADGIDILTGSQGAFPLSCTAIPALYHQLHESQQHSISPNSTIAKRQSSKSMKVELIGSCIRSSAKLVTVVASYTPTRSDELLLKVGMQIVVLKQFGDGWGRGYDPESGGVGMFPLSFIGTLGEESEGEKGHTAGLTGRTSSLNVDAKAVVQKGVKNGSLVSITEEENSGVSLLVLDGVGKIVVHPYSATKADELELVLGTHVIILKQFKDGWARGQCVENGRI
ncbi:hypothetical protein HDU98_000918, partial [Podochytrium sp. JEL0797]